MSCHRGCKPPPRPPETHPPPRSPPPPPPPGAPALRLVTCRCAPRTPLRSTDWCCKKLFCTRDTCYNPEFCITFKPDYCPHVVAIPPLQESWSSYRSEDWPPSPPYPYPSTPTPWPQPPEPKPWTPPHPSHALHPSGPIAYHPHVEHTSYPSSFSSDLTHSVPFHTCAPNPQPAVTTRAKSTNVTCEKRKTHRSIGKPSFTVLGDKSRDDCCQMSSPRLDVVSGYLRGTCHPISRIAPSRAGRGTSENQQSLQRRAHTQPAPRDCRQAYPKTRGSSPFGNNMAAAAGARCECRMPPALAFLRCTANLGGLCNCTDCDTNK